MKGEIDREWYCTSGNNSAVTCLAFERCRDGKESCFFRHRKHPTPEQFREEYGGEYPDDGAVYFIAKEHPLVDRPWHIDELSFPKSKPHGKDFHIVCACTPWGKPEDNWRPS